MDLSNTVQPIAAITRPMGNTKLDEPKWFVCAMPNASMHRPDGKKLPFVNGFLKVLFHEDLNYLQNEVDGGNPVVREANQQEREQARMMEDPLGVIKDSMLPEVKKNVLESLTVDDLESLLASKRANAGKVIITEPEKNAATAGAGPIAGVAQAIPANETVAARAVRLAGEARAALGRNPNAFTPGSTSNVPGADSNSQAQG